MKILNLLFILLALFLAISYLLITPTLNKLTNCINQNDQQITVLTENAKNQRWSKEQVCINGKELVLNNLACIDGVEKESIISIALIDNLSRLIKPQFSGIKNIVSIHNKECANYPYTLINK